MITTNARGALAVIAVVVAVIVGGAKLIADQLVGSGPHIASVTSAKVTVERRGAAPTVTRTIGAAAARHLATVINALPGYHRSGGCGQEIIGFVDLVEFSTPSGLATAQVSVGGCLSVTVRTPSGSQLTLDDANVTAERAVLASVGLPPGYGL